MWLSIYPIPIEITYDQGKYFIGHKFRKSLIEYEYGVTSKPSTLVNNMSNAILESICQVLGNLVRNFNVQKIQVDENDPCMGILAASAFVIFSTISRQKGYSLGQLIFGCDMILLINYRVNWELMCQQKQTQINKDNAHENKHRVDYDYKVGDKVMLTKLTAYKYGTPYKGPFLVTHCFTNGTLNLKCGAIRINYNIRRIYPYKLDTKVEDFNSKNMDDTINI